MDCVEVDTIIHKRRHDLLDDEVFGKLLGAAKKGQFNAGVFGIPCSTFSVARIHDGKSRENAGPSCVRDRDHKRGLEGLDRSQQREVDNANKLVQRSIELATMICKTGGAVIFENPSDRGNPSAEDSAVRSLFEDRWKAHCPLWILPEMQNAKQDLGLREVTFSQCMLGGAFQKWTTLWYSPSLAHILDELHVCLCTHQESKHAEIARGRTKWGDWISAEAAAYPARMNLIITNAIEHHISTLPSQQTRVLHLQSAFGTK